MLKIIDDHKDPDIQKFLGLKGSNGDQILIGEGFKVVQKLNEVMTLKEVLTSQKTYDENSEFFSKINCKVLLAEDKFISEHVGYKFHQGIFAISDHPGYMDISSIEGRTLIMNNLDNAENVGALIRSATGLGFKNILLDSQSCSPFLKRAIRVSMGNVFYANIFKVDDLPKTILILRDRGFSIYSAANENGSISYKDLDSKKENIGVIIGNEGHGISDVVKESSTATIRISVEDKVEHLNAAAAGAILMSYFSPL